MDKKIILNPNETKLFRELVSLNEELSKLTTNYDEVKHLRMKELAHELHMSLKSRNIEPIHHRYMVEKNDYNPDQLEFYDHVHYVEDLIKFVNNPEANLDLEDVTMGKEFSFKYHTSRWTHYDNVRVTRTEYGWKFNHLREYFLSKKGEADNFYDLFTQDSVSVPSNLHFKFIELWDQAANEGYTEIQVQRKLDDIGMWISQSELYEPNMLDVVYHKTGVVTFLDILGWKGVSEGMENPLDAAKKLIDQSEFRSHVTRTSHKYKVEGFKHHMISISDTIILFTPCSPENYYEVLLYHGLLSKYFINKSLENQLLLRGATTIGEFSNFQNVFVGPAIDEAAGWHESCNWMGVICTQSAGKILEEAQSSGEWVLYSAPYKAKIQMIHKKTYCVNWAILQGYSQEKLWKAFRLDKIKDKDIIRKEVKIKFDNTMKFHDFSNFKSNDE